MSRLAPRLRFHVLRRDNWTCRYCGKRAPNVVLEVDHLVPVSRGGTDEPWNLLTACFDCNRGKRDDSLPSYMVKGLRQLRAGNDEEAYSLFRFMLELAWQEGWMAAWDSIGKRTAAELGPQTNGRMESIQEILGLIR